MTEHDSIIQFHQTSCSLQCHRAHSLNEWLSFSSINEMKRMFFQPHCKQVNFRSAIKLSHILTASLFASFILTTEYLIDLLKKGPTEDFRSSFLEEGELVIFLEQGVNSLWIAFPPSFLFKPTLCEPPSVSSMCGHLWAAPWHGKLSKSSIADKTFFLRCCSFSLSVLSHLSFQYRLLRLSQLDLSDNQTPQISFSLQDLNIHNLRFLDVSKV